MELKKKYKSVADKRHVVMPEQQAINWLCEDKDHLENSQIVAEIDYFCNYYETLHPVVFLNYEREMFYSMDGNDFRVAFDENILSREEEVSLEADIWGTSLFHDDMVLMELKTSGGIPLWMASFLTQQAIYKTSFSKYGAAYCNKNINNAQGGHLYA